MANDFQISIIDRLLGIQRQSSNDDRTRHHIDRRYRRKEGVSCEVRSVESQQMPRGVALHCSGKTGIVGLFALDSEG